MRDTHVRRGAEEATVGEVLGKHRETDLALTVRRPIGPEEVREIVGLTDDVYRNHWISYAYFDISRRLHAHIGNNASWCTFSTWSSRMSGQYLRVDEPNPT